MVCHQVNNVLANSFRNALQNKLAVGPSRLLAGRAAALGEGPGEMAFSFYSHFESSQAFR